MKIHLHTVHEGHKDYKCESCGKSFSQAGDLKKHIHTVHEGHKDYKCESCGKSFSQAGYLKIHNYRIHDGHKDFKCESCGKLFSESGGLKKHIHTIHKGIQRKCDFGNNQRNKQTQRSDQSKSDHDLVLGFSPEMLHVLCLSETVAHRRGALCR